MQVKDGHDTIGGADPRAQSTKLDRGKRLGEWRRRLLLLLLLPPTRMGRTG
jgi:hypothetical protein